MTEGVAVDLPTMERCCQNCACYMEVKNPANQLQSQGFCRRDPPGAERVRVQVPRLNSDGKTPAIDRQGRPVMETREQMAYVYRLSARNFTCFDGWRPLGTEPGDKWQSRFVLEKAEPAVRALSPELAEALEALLVGPTLTPPAPNE